MKYINHPRPPIRHISGETLVRITDRLGGMLNLTAVDPVVIQATVITEGGTTEIVGEGGNPMPPGRFFWRPMTWNIGLPRPLDICSRVRREATNSTLHTWLCRRVAVAHRR